MSILTLLNTHPCASPNFSCAIWFGRKCHQDFFPDQFNAINQQSVSCFSCARGMKLPLKLVYLEAKSLVLYSTLARNVNFRFLYPSQHHKNPTLDTFSSILYFLLHFLNSCVWTSGWCVCVQTGTGGRVTVMQTTLPTVGPGALENREGGSKPASLVSQP